MCVKGRWFRQVIQGVSAFPLSLALTLMGLFVGGCPRDNGLTLKSFPEMRAQTEKMFLGSFRFHEGGVDGRDAGLGFGTIKLVSTESADFLFQLVDEKDAVLMEYGVKDPRLAVLDEGDPKKRGFVQMPETIVVAKFPFHVRAKRLRVVKSDKTATATLNLQPAIQEFCGAHKADQDCSRM
jgi:hypothetical protein